MVWKVATLACLAGIEIDSVQQGCPNSKKWEPVEPDGSWSIIIGITLWLKSNSGQSTVEHWDRVGSDRLNSSRVRGFAIKYKEME